MGKYILHLTKVNDDILKFKMLRNRVFFCDWMMILLSVHDVRSIFQSKGRW
jgi:hypothetical protein